LVLIAWAGAALGATCTSAASGNWNAGATWASGCGASGPVAGDTVNIGTTGAFTVTIPTGVSAAAASVTIGAAVTGAKALTLASSTSTLSVTGAVTINAGSSNNTTTALNVNDGTASMASLAFTGGTTSKVVQLLINTGTVTVTGNVTVAGTTSNIQITFSSTGTLKVGASFVGGAPFGFTPGTGTVEYNGAGAQIVYAYSYNNLTLSGSGTKTPAAGTLTVGGNFTLATGATYAGNTNNPVVNLAGNFSNSGTFNSGTGVFSFNSSNNPQTLTGTTTFNNLTINNTGSFGGGTVTINSNVTVSTLLSLTAGGVITGSNTLITTANCPGSMSRSSGSAQFVAGFLRLHVPTGTTTCTFFVSASDVHNYEPIAVTFTGVTTAGDLTGSISPSAGQHPNISTSGLDSTRDVARYWTLTNSGLVLSSYDATFNFNAGDVIGGADTTQFVVQRWDGAAWNVTTAGTRTSTSTQATGITAFGDFAVGDAKVTGGTPSSFNAVQPGASATTGKIFTKIAGQNFALDIIALDASNNILTGFTGTVAVEVVDNTSGGACSGLPLIVAFTSQTFVAGDAGRHPLTSPNTVADVYQNAKVRIKYPTSSPTVTVCSTDNFAIRPNTLGSFAVTDTDWQTTGTPGARALNRLTFAGTPVHKAGRPFSVRATAVNAAGTPATTTNYVGAPAATLTACVGAACTATFGALTLSTTFAAGQLASDVASYDNVGSFSLQLVDSSFASVDAADTTGDCTATGRYVCSATLSVGRFVPDHFAVALNTPTFGTACSAGGFTYVGQTFNYTVQPVITVTAQNFANGTTTLYNGAWLRITNTSLSQVPYDTQAARYSRFDALGGGTTPAPDTTLLPATTGDPAIGAFTNGAGALTFASGTGLGFVRSTTTPNAPFNADIALALNVIDADGVAFASNPASFGAATSGNGIAFSSGRPMRFGRLRLMNALGSERLNLAVPMQTEYWNGSGFVLNTNDSCTTITSPNVGLGSYQQNLAAGNTSVSIPVGAFSGGQKTLTLSAPGAGKNGSVDVVVNLAPNTTVNTCNTWSPSAPTPTGAGMSYLRGNWCGANYDRDPVARANFGLYGGSQTNQPIYQRENY
jgi:hypothetical protein